MVGKIADLVNGLFLILFFARNDDLGALFAHLFQDLLLALLEQVGGIAALLGAILAALDELVQSLPAELLQLRRDVYFVEEAALGTGVAGGAGFDHFHHQSIGVAVGGDGHHPLHVAAGLALTPDLLTAAAPEHSAALGNGERQRLGVHVCEGEHLFGVVVLHDGRDQALFIKFQIHNGSPSPDGDITSLAYSVRKRKSLRVVFAEIQFRVTASPRAGEKHPGVTAASPRRLR